MSKILQGSIALIGLFLFADFLFTIPLVGFFVALGSIFVLLVSIDLIREGFKELYSKSNSTEEDEFFNSWAQKELRSRK